MVSSTDVESFSILGHIEWFDLFHEIILTFCTVSLYFLYNKYKDKLPTLIFSTLVFTTIFYLLYTAIILLNLNHILDLMNVAENIDKVRQYLTLETFSLFFTFLNSILFIAFLIMDKKRIFYLLLATKTVFFFASDFYLIPKFNFLGVAYSNILVNILIFVISLWFVNHYLKIFNEKKLSFFWVKEFLGISSFSGGQIFLDNFMYGLVVMQMINMLNNQGDYWLANNFIWGILLLPSFVLAEVIKRDALKTNQLTSYFYVSGILLLLWLVTIPLWDNFFAFFYQFDDALNERVLSIVLSLLPYYVVFLVSSIFNSRFIGLGNTHYLLITSIIVNCMYYPMMLLLIKNDVFAISMNFIVHMFGIGIVINAIIGICFYFFVSKKQHKVKL